MIETLLGQVSLFSSLSPGELQQVATVMRLAHYEPDVLLFREDQPGERFRIVLEGELEVVKALGSAGERLLGVLGPGQFFGEVGLLLGDRRRSATIRTRSAVALLEMGRADFEALLQRHPALGLAILRAIVTRARQADDALIHDLQQKNEELAQAYQALRAAQAAQLEKQRMEVELQTAQRIQQRFLPKTLPNLPNWDVAAYWQPALIVSGDFYDFVSLPDGRLAVLAADVTGKGVPAALVMAMAHSMLRTAAELSANPATVLQRVNDLLTAQLEPLMFVTCCFCVLEPRSGSMTYANAGHMPPLRQTARGPVELRATGMPLGLMPGMRYEEKEAQLEPGDNLFLYSDGLVEAHNGEGEMFGFARLHAALEKQSGCKELIEDISARLAAFTGCEGNQEDDVTLVAVQRMS